MIRNPSPVNRNAIPSPSPVNRNVIPSPSPVNRNVIRIPSPVNRNVVPSPSPVNKNVVPSPSPASPTPETSEWKIYLWENNYDFRVEPGKQLDKVDMPPWSSLKLEADKSSTYEVIENKSDTRNIVKVQTVKNPKKIYVKTLTAR